jgi:hypothetical protein
MLEPKRDRIHAARRAAHVARLVRAGWPEDAAEAAVAAWEAYATAEGRQRGATAFWDGCEPWMADWRTATRRGRPSEGLLSRIPSAGDRSMRAQSRDQ